MATSALCKIGLCSRHKPLKLMVLGQSGVGKTALVVRFITRRYIGEYDPTLEKVYTFHTLIDKEIVYFEILDAAGQPQENDSQRLEANIRWAEAFILMYSVTDKCSFDECNRLKFLINYNKRRRRLNSSKEAISEVPVVLVGNKIDQWGDRMVSQEDGHKRSREIGCICFHEISVRESIDQVRAVFRDACLFWKVQNKFPRLKRSPSEVLTWDPALPNKPSMLGRRWTEVDMEEELEEKIDLGFRGRASTEGHLPTHWRYLPQPQSHADRRMSISMRGNNASY